jgi:hypothetical protein
LQPDGSHVRLVAPEGEPRHRAQEELLAIRPSPPTVEAGGAATNGSAANGAATLGTLARPATA